MPKPEITAEEWNRDIVETIRRRLPFRSKQLRSGGWRHPYFHSLRFDAGLKRWLYQIKPGFLNGKPVEIETEGVLVGPRTLDRIGRDPLDAETVTAHLTEHPEIPIPGLRSIGVGAGPTSLTVDIEGGITQTFEPVPDFFLERGVYEPSRDIDSGFDTGIVQTIDDIPEDARLLRAFDTWISVDRLSASVDWQFGTAEEATFATFVVNYSRDTPANPLAYIRSSAEFTPRPEPDLSDVLSGVIADSDLDECKLATVYFMSAPGADPSSELDGSWQPFVAHDVFFNLNYAPKKPPEFVKPEPITLLTGLAAGIANPTIGALLAPANDFTNAARQAFAARQINGTFWTT